MIRRAGSTKVVIVVKEAKKKKRKRGQRGSRRDIQWKRACLKRDGYKCVLCNETKGLVVHHILDWKNNKEKRFDVNNGLTLCPIHHALFHPERPDMLFKAMKWKR